MKICKLFFSVLAFLILATCSLTAQIEVVTNGKVKLGNPRTGDDTNNETTVNAFGLGTDAFRIGARLSFGDYGASSTSGSNIFVGEYSTTATGGFDSDALQLHGKNGIWFTTQGAASNPFVGMKLESNGQLLVRSTVSQNQSSLSDIRLKSNIRGIENSVGLLRQLNGIKYDFNLKLVSQEQMAALDRAQPTNDKERASIAKTRAEFEQLNQPVKDQYGFSAQAVKEIFPELVTETPDGYLAVNYVALIPILVESIKAQQVQIEKLQQQLTDIQTNCCKKE